MELSEPGIVDIKSLHGFKKQLNTFMEEKYIRDKDSAFGLHCPWTISCWSLEGYIREVKLFVCHVFISFAVVCCQKQIISWIDLFV